MLLSVSKLVKKIILAVVMCVLASVANADIPVEFYQKTRSGKNIPGFKDYVVGLGRGVFWANVSLDAAGRDKLFCLPPKMNLDEGIILSILDQEIRQPSSGKAWESTTPIELIMVVAFTRRFACEK